MSELRHDPIQKCWVIIAPERQRRPDDFPSPEPASDEKSCPFCEGRESKTPPEIAAIRRETAPNQPGWDVRVIPNKSPALRIEGSLDHRELGAFGRMNGIGAHEVIIETPNHSQEMSDAPIEHIHKILQVYRERLVDLKRDLRFQSILIFKNKGTAAGALLSHPHTQLIAAPVTPWTLAEELKSAQDHYLRKGHCLFCDLIAQELDSGQRIVSADDHFVVLAPYASRYPFEILVAPRHHHFSFADADDEMLYRLAVTFKEVLLRINKCLKNPPYNFMIHTIPSVQALANQGLDPATIEKGFHWHIELMPRLTPVGGIEWGSGLYINPTAPEEAARFLRDVEL